MTRSITVPCTGVPLLAVGLTAPVALDTTVKMVGANPAQLAGRLPEFPNGLFAQSATDVYVTGRVSDKAFHVTP